ncbi:MAG: hypothetical protein NXI04_08380 [Planctomycetaceae bacterium]|nr:hypothetical protein [Planctomycetaceae bacterium]
MVNFILTMLWETAFAAAAVSILVAGVMHWFCRGRLPASVAVSCGFFAGWASQDWGRLQPKRYLDWSPWASILLATVACLILLSDRRWIRLLLVLAACGVSAWLLVPDFPRLVPPRSYAVALVAVLGLISVSAVLLADCCVSERSFRVAFVMIGGVCSLIQAQSFGLKFSQMVGMLTAAVAGPLLFPSPQGKGGVGVVFLPLLTAMMFMGYANSSSDVPVFCYFLPPFACLPLLIHANRNSPGTAPGDDLQTAGSTTHSDPGGRSGSFTRPTTKATLVSWGLVVAVLIIAAVPAILAHPPWEEELG